MTKLLIDKTWEGQPIPSEEQAELTLRRTNTHLEISIHAPFYKDPAPESPPGPTDGLWNYEVVELFLLEDTDDFRQARYTELEWGPYGHHLVLQLEGTRNPITKLLPMAFQAERHNDHWTGTARIANHLLPPKPWRCNAYAIHGTGVQRRYLAMTPVPGPHPDYHRLSFFQPLPPSPQTHEQNIEETTKRNKTRKPR